MANLHLISGSKHIILLVIVIAQFAGTSLWFASNAVMEELTLQFALPAGALGDLTSAVQFGFISGTLVFAFLAIADRYSPVKVFLICSILGAAFNSMIVFFPFGYGSFLSYRFLTGFFLAGIYPVGMKIAADWFKGELGKALGFLVGALVLGTGLPHLIKFLGVAMQWANVIHSVSLFALVGGFVLYLLVDDGPHRSMTKTFEWNALVQIFSVRKLRSSAFGYFGHMWELYSFWAFLPVMIAFYNDNNSASEIPVSLWAFLIIAAGFLGCSIGGIIAQKAGSARVAFTQLFISFICCLLSPLIYQLDPVFFLSFLVIWGITVVGDSPQYSTLVAWTAPKKWIGSSLTIVNCIGFAITIVSIQCIKFLELSFGITNIMVILAIGPLIGLISIFPLLNKNDFI